jgi:hypothetical protein
MKRREAINLIRDSIQDYMHDHFHDYGILCETILSNLEEVGMIPPPMSWHVGYESYKELKWEDEDE